MKTTVISKRGVPLSEYMTLFDNEILFYPIEIGDTSDVFPNLIPTTEFKYPIVINITDIFNPALAMFDVQYPVTVNESATNNLVPTEDSYYPISIGNR
jgi:hypothetical protein